MPVIHEISVIIDWSDQMAGQVEKPERCKVSGDDLIESWLKLYCDKKCLNYSDVDCWYWRNANNGLYIRVDATHTFHQKVVGSQGFEIKIVVKPGVCYVAALRAQLAKAQSQSNSYEELAEAREVSINNWINRYQQRNSEHNDFLYNVQIETVKNAEKMAALTMEWTNLKARVADLESECGEANDKITSLQSETVKYSKDLHDAHVRAQHEHSKYLLRLSKVGMKRSGGAGAVDEDVSEMTDVPDVLDGLNARELGGRTVAWLRNAKAKASQFVQKLGEAEDALRAEIPSSHLCPITQNRMQDPVVLPETGHSYERKSIEKWFERRVFDDNGNLRPATCPKTNLPLTSKNLIPNHDLRNSIEEMQARV